MKIMLVLILLLIIMLDGAFAEMDSNGLFDFSNLDHGVVTVFNPDDTGKIKLMVTSGDSKIFYNIIDESQSFSLQFGTGYYSFDFYSNIGGDSYKRIAHSTRYVDLISDLDPFLSKIQNIYWEDDMKPILKAKELAGGHKNDLEKIAAIYDYVLNNITYDNDKIDDLTYSYIPDVEEVYNNEKGICYDYASLLASMLRSIDIPTKVVKGYREGISEYHAWNEVYVEGEWIILDPTLDSINHVNFNFVDIFKYQEEFKKIYEY